MPPTNVFVKRLDGIKALYVERNWEKPFEEL